MMSQYVRSLLELTSELNKHGISWAFTSHYSSVVHNAREMTLSGTNQNSLDQMNLFQYHHKS